VTLDSTDQLTCVVLSAVGVSLFALTFVVGCGSDAASPTRTDAPAVAVMFQGDPLAGVQVTLSDGSTESPLATAVTGDDGKAYFTELPSPEPEQYRVSLESLGTGGWMLDPKVVEPFCETHLLDPLRRASPQQLVLPPRAVRPLDPRINR
jgi:hypothetical protein